MAVVRPSLNSYYMSLASEAAKRSTCLKHMMGCVLVRGSVVVTGWLSTPSKSQHCSEYFKMIHETEWNLYSNATPVHKKNPSQVELPIPVDQLEAKVLNGFQRKDYLYTKKTQNSSWAAYLNTDEFALAHEDWVAHGNEIHPEISVLLQTMNEGISVKNAVLYTVHSPCSRCANIIKSAGIAKVYYSTIWKEDPKGIDFLRANEISCNHYACQTL